MLAGVTQSECCTCTDIPSQSKRTFCLEDAQQKVNTNVEVIKRWTRCDLSQNSFPISDIQCSLLSNCFFVNTCSWIGFALIQKRWC